MRELLCPASGFHLADVASVSLNAGLSWSLGETDDGNY